VDAHGQAQWWEETDCAQDLPATAADPQPRPWRAAVVEGSNRGPLRGPEPFLVDYLLAYLPRRRLRVADPFATDPFIFMALSQEGRLASAFVRASDLNVIRFRTLASSMPEVHEPARLNERLACRELDLVLSFQVLERKRRRATVLADKPDVVLNASAPLHDVLGALPALAEDGEAIVLVPSYVADESGPESVRAVLEMLGFHLNAVVEVSKGYRAAPGTNASFMFIGRQPVSELFVGRLTGSSDVGRRARELRTRKPGRSAEDGRLVSPTAEASVSRLVAQERLRQLGAKTGLQPRALRTFLARPLAKLLRRGETWEDEPNAVYLPTFAAAQVWTRLDELVSAPHAYYQLVLDPDKALAEYVAAFLRSPLGLAVRDSVSSGGVRAHIRRPELEDMPVYAPSVVEQQEFVSVRGGIRDLRLQLDDLERRLVSHPRAAKKVRREMERLNERDGFGAWLDTLPFPLASIAHTYRAAAKAKPDRRSSALLRLFEGSAEFACAVLLSGYRGTPYWPEHHETWLANEDGSRMRLDAASFGTWTTLGSRIAGTTRELLSDTDHRKALLEGFRLSTPTLLAGLSSKDLWKTLDSARTERNREKAHGSLESDARDLAQLQRLEDLLDAYRRATAETFDGVLLFRPGGGELVRGIYHYASATMLMGANPIFTEQPRRSHLGLEANEVYLAEDVDVISGALQLAPFVRFMSGPKSEQNACWFYSRIERGKPVFISHHYAADPVPQDDDVLLAWLADLAGETPST
jgi:hypothetical protein